MLEINVIMDKLSNKPIKGMLDDFPEDMALYKWISHKINKIAESNLFCEYDAPILEPIDIFAAKSSEELVKEQSYSFIDKGNRNLILRPEMTPSMARMVSQKVKEASKPFRWYSIPKCYRYEQPQKGRLREFRQLNVDLIGDDSILADFEILQIIVEIMKDFKVPSDAFKININHRNIIANFLQHHDFNDSNILDFFKLIDKKDKLPEEAFNQSLQSKFNSKQIDFIYKYLNSKKFSDLSIKNEALQHYIFNFEQFIDQLNLSNQIEFAPTTVRGLDYYTGLVFEIYQTNGSIKRALFGGGRYDNLISSYTKESLSGIGFGMGIYIFILFLKELRLVPQHLMPQKSCLISLLDLKNYPFGSKVNQMLKERGFQTELSHHSGSFKKIFNKVEKKNFQYLVILGDDEVINKKIKIKEIKSKRENEMFIS